MLPNFRIYLLSDLIEDRPEEDAVLQPDVEVELPASPGSPSRSSVPPISAMHSDSAASGRAWMEQDGTID